MNPTIAQISLALVMLAAGVALIMWFRSYLAAGSRRRMTAMLQRIGLDPQILAQKDNEAIMREVTSRCRKCSAEDPCERWLEGKAGGENTFCPNAAVFDMLRRGDLAH